MQQMASIIILNTLLLAGRTVMHILQRSTRCSFMFNVGSPTIDPQCVKQAWLFKYFFLSCCKYPHHIQAWNPTVLEYLLLIHIQHHRIIHIQKVKHILIWLPSSIRHIFAVHVVPFWEFNHTSNDELMIWHVGSTDQGWLLAVVDSSDSSFSTSPDSRVESRMTCDRVRGCCSTFFAI